MMKRVVRLGDKTSHGGVVISASSSFEIMGRPAALLNDTVSCPKHGDNVIVECSFEYDENGRGIVYEGCKTVCGATLYASCQDMEIG
ncbi:PAAR domain-containing protein [Providencia stuartii]|uniref:PAAR domain-containing protein n=1 Tax=Providencia stuartii TaxID=588 RepID=UPI00332C533B